MTRRRSSIFIFLLAQGKQLFAYLGVHFFIVLGVILGLRSWVDVGFVLILIILIDDLFLQRGVLLLLSAPPLSLVVGDGVLVERHVARDAHDQAVNVLVLGPITGPRFLLLAQDAIKY